MHLHLWRHLVEDLRPHQGLQVRVRRRVGPRRSPLLRLLLLVRLLLVLALLRQGEGGVFVVGGRGRWRGAAPPSYLPRVEQVCLVIGVENLDVVYEHVPCLIVSTRYRGVELGCP